jgi:hypothetical protein
MLLELVLLECLKSTLRNAFCWGIEWTDKLARELDEKFFGTEALHSPF